MSSGFVDPGQQAWMLLDRVRVDAYARAIAATVRPGDVVLDIGSGSGILALLAAKAGARRVYAVERTAMVELIRAHAKENGFADVIVPLHQDFLDVALDAPGDEKPRVIIGEVLGHFAADEGQHALYAHAKKIARADAVFLPSSYQMLFAAAAPKRIDADLHQLSSMMGVSLTSLVTRLRSYVTHFTLGAADLLGPETASAPIVTTGPLPRVFTSTVQVERTGAVTGISVAFVATLAPGITLSTSPLAPQTHWGQTVFPVDPPIEAVAGDVLHVEITPRVITDHDTYAWTVRLGDLVRHGDASHALVGELDDEHMAAHAHDSSEANPTQATETRAARVA
jgi:2-polyprenyl-3-methyl-5-hydroxy-6-metoxy-1,4-benzoquinol methylase